MNIEKLPSGSYRVRKMYNGKRHTLTFDHKPTVNEVNARLTDVIREYDPCFDLPKGSFEKYAREYIENRSNVLSPSTVVSYNRLINALSDEFKRTNLFEISQNTIQKEMNKYSEGHAPKTVRNMHGFIATILGAYRPQFVIRSTLPQRIEKERYLPTEDDIKAILELSKGTEDHIAIQLGTLSLRVSEICALEMSDLKGNELRIHSNLVWNNGWIKKESPKTNAGNRTIYLPDKLVAEIKAKGYFFKYTPNKLNDHLHKYQKTLNIPPFRFHDLRHFFASYASTIMSEADAMALGGWESDYVFKKVYRESMKDKRKESAIKYNSIFD